MRPAVRRRNSAILFAPSSPSGDRSSRPPGRSWTNKERIMGVLDGKTTVITGGGGALGRAYALAIAQAGAAVAVSDVNLDTARVTADAIAKAGGKALAIKADVTDAAAFEGLFDRAEAELDPLDVLVNVAGMYTHSLVAEMPEQEWDQVIQ